MAISFRLVRNQSLAEMTGKKASHCRRVIHVERRRAHQGAEGGKVDGDPLRRFRYVDISSQLMAIVGPSQLGSHELADPVRLALPRQQHRVEKTEIVLDQVLAHPIPVVETDAVLDEPGQEHLQRRGVGTHALDIVEKAAGFVGVDLLEQRGPVGEVAVYRLPGKTGDAGHVVEGRLIVAELGKTGDRRIKDPLPRLSISAAFLLRLLIHPHRRRLPWVTHATYTIIVVT